MNAMANETSEVLLRISGMAVRVRNCTPTIAAHTRKYNGNNLLCKVPKTLLGRFLNIVMPATKVVYTTVPNHVANESK